MLILSGLAFLFTLISIMCFAFWQSSLVPMITQNFPSEKKEQYHSFWGKISFISLSACVSLLALFGSFSTFDIWNAIFYSISVFLLLLFFNSRRKRTMFLNLKFFNSRFGNYIVSEVLLPYLFIFSWIKLLVIFVTGNP